MKENYDSKEKNTHEKERQHAVAEPQRVLTEHQRKVEEAAGMPIDWGMANASTVAHAAEQPKLTEEPEFSAKLDGAIKQGIDNWRVWGSSEIQDEGYLRVMLREQIYRLLTSPVAPPPPRFAQMIGGTWAGHNKGVHNENSFCRLAGCHSAAPPVAPGEQPPQKETVCFNCGGETLFPKQVNLCDDCFTELDAVESMTNRIDVRMRNELGLSGVISTEADAKDGADSGPCRQQSVDSPLPPLGEIIICEKCHLSGYVGALCPRCGHRIGNEPAQERPEDELLSDLTIAVGCIILWCNQEISDLDRDGYLSEAKQKLQSIKRKLAAQPSPQKKEEK